MNETVIVMETPVVEEYEVVIEDDFVKKIREKCGESAYKRYIEHAVRYYKVTIVKSTYEHSTLLEGVMTVKIGDANLMGFFQSPNTTNEKIQIEEIKKQILACILEKEMQFGNLSGVKYCVENGVDPNVILEKEEYVGIITKFGYSESALNVLKYLVDNGLNLFREERGIPYINRMIDVYMEVMKRVDDETSGEDHVQLTKEYGGVLNYLKSIKAC